MGETLPIFSTSFNRCAQIEARADHLSADTGALLLREIMERTGIIEWMTERLIDPRNPHMITYPLADLLRTSLLLLGQGWRDQDDADRLRHDPSFRVANDSRRGTAALQQESVLPSQPTLSRLLDVLSGQTNQEVLREAVIEQALRRLEMSNQGRRYKRLIVDVDGLPAQVHGQQAGSEYNGYYGQRMFHALIASCAESGDLLGGTLRPGAVGSADGALEFIEAVVERVRRVCESVLLRIDAGFADGRTLTGLESSGIDYVARLRNNAVLDRMAQPYLRRPPGRPPREGRVWCHELRYQADSWEHPRRVVLVVLERPGELFVDHFWLITNLRRDRYSGARLLGLYRMRGKAEGHMGELMDVLAPAFSSAARPKSHYRGRPLEAVTQPEEAGVRSQNETLLLLNLLAYELLHAGRCVMEHATGTGWSLRRLRERVLRVASRVVRHGGRLMFVIAQHAAADWLRLWGKLGALDWAPS